MARGAEPLRAELARDGSGAQLFIFPGTPENSVALLPPHEGPPPRPARRCAHSLRLTMPTVKEPLMPIETEPLSLHDLEKEVTVTTTPIIDKLWPDGTLGFIGGPRKAGKSSYALEEALCLSVGWSVFSTYAVTRPMRVLFIEEEDESAKVKERAQALVEQRGFKLRDLSPDGVRFVIEKGFRADQDRWLDWLRRQIEVHHTDVIYLDALWRMVEDPSLERSSDILRAVEGITRVNQEMGTAFRVLHHTVKKTKKRASGQNLLGGPTLRGWARSSLLLGEPSGGLTTISYEGKGAFTGPVCQMRVLATEPAPLQRSMFLGLEHVPLKGREPSSVGPQVSGQEEKVLNLVAAEPRGAAALVEAGVPRSTVYETLRRLEEKELVEQGEHRLWRRVPVPVLA
jgi:hypothetical protein